MSEILGSATLTYPDGASRRVEFTQEMLDKASDSTETDDSLFARIEDLTTRMVTMAKQGVLKGKAMIRQGESEMRWPLVKAGQDLRDLWYRRLRRLETWRKKKR